MNPQEINEYVKNKHYKQVNSVLVWQDGEITASQYFNGFNKDSRNVIRSVVKSILSIAAGICLDEGCIKCLNEPIYHYLEAFGKGIHPYHKAITIRNLLSMSSGIYFVGGVHYHCPQMNLLRRCPDWVEFIAQTDVVSVPGTKYNYSEFDVILLTAVLQKAVGESLFSFINRKLYLPLGIHSTGWWVSRCGIPYSCAEAGEGNGGPNESPSNLTALDMLKIGQLFLQKGSFENHQIVSEAYVTEAVTPLTINPEYGYLWWLSKKKDWYGCRGFGGQSITVVPKKNKIVIIQATPTARGMFYDDLLQMLLYH